MVVRVPVRMGVVDEGAVVDAEERPSSERFGIGQFGIEQDILSEVILVLIDERILYRQAGAVKFRIGVEVACICIIGIVFPDV